MTWFLILFFLGAVSACAAETVLDIPKNEAHERIRNSDVGFIIETDPSRAVEISKIDAALPFYAALLIEEQDANNERTPLLLNEALKSPIVRDAAMKKLSAADAVPHEGETGIAGGIEGGRAAVANRDYNEAMLKFNAVLDEGVEAAAVFLADKELLGDLGKAFQYASVPGDSAIKGAGLFVAWEKELRSGTMLWAAPAPDRDERRYLLLYYAGRMRRQRAGQLAKQSARQREEYGEAKTLFADALHIAPDSRQADACIWYILDSAMAKNGENTAETNELIKEYAHIWHDPLYFSDFFEKYTHLLCLNRRWNEIAELFPYIQGYGSPELSAKYAFILANVVELNFLTQERAAEALEPPPSGSRGAKTARQTSSHPPQPDDFYQIVYDSNVITGRDVSSFYYMAYAAEKLGKKPRINIPNIYETKNTYGESGGVSGGDPLVKEFLEGFFIFGAARFAYPYIIENVPILPIPDLRALAKSLAGAERWSESIRVARTYMQRPDYKPVIDDIKICYPFAFKELVTEFSSKTGMDENLLQGLIRTESLFIPDIVSRAGAVGLAQLMPETAGEMARRLAHSGGVDYTDDGELDLTNPELNIHLGALYFQQLKGRMNSTLLALLSYNGGMNRIRRWRSARPALNDALFLESIEYAETRDYGRQVLSAAAIYRCLRSLPDTGNEAPPGGRGIL
jgi:soluble lytic murein transglycosylase